MSISRVVLPPGFACLFALTLACLPARAQTQEVFDPQSLKDSGTLSAAQDSTLRARRELIMSEVSMSSANEWVGTYVAADGLTSSAQLDWAPSTGFLVWWNTCSHSWRDEINFGRVDFRGGSLRVTSELASGGKVFVLPHELITVKWGEQHYLVPLSRLIAFCYAARNAGRTSEIEQFFVKQSDRDKRRFGVPAVPSHYRKYLVGPPVQATILEVTSQPQAAFKFFTLNVGRTAGVVPRMKFFATSPSNVYMVVEVTNVGEDSSEAYVITSGFKNRSERNVMPKAGWNLTSRTRLTRY